MKTLAQVSEEIAEKTQKIPFQRVIDKLLPEIELLLDEGYTYRVIAEELSTRGCKTSDGKELSVAYLGGALNRARRKIQEGKLPRWAAKTADSARPQQETKAAAERPGLFDQLPRQGLESLAVKPRKKVKPDD